MGRDLDSGAPAIELRGLRKQYDTFTALDGVELTVRRGELFALLGPNGAGKTTTMRILMGFLKPSAGGARIFGLDCFEQRVELKRLVGYLPDEPVFYEYLRGREIIEFSGELHGMSRESRRLRTAALLDQLELADAIDDYAVNYSRGMKKKLALVCALLHSPELLILDEPTSGLDPLVMRRLNEILIAERERGTTILLSSHVLDHVERLCERMAIVAGGRIAAVGTLEELRRERGANASLEELFFTVTARQAETEASEPAGTDDDEGERGRPKR
jgi:ABC-2 type transport system ATP-binding protein